MRQPAGVVLVLLAGSTAPAADVIERIGNVGQIAVPASGLLVAAVHHDRPGALQLAEAFATTMAVVYILKPTINRQRPGGGSQSFPSGHAMVKVFSLSRALQRSRGLRWAAASTAVRARRGLGRRSTGR